MFLKHWTPRSHYCFAEGDSAPSGGDSAPNGSGSGGPSSGSGSGSPPPASPDWTQFIGALENVGARIDGLHETVKTGTETARTKEPASQPAPPPNFEEMSQTDLASYFEQWANQQIQAQIKAALDPIVQFVTNFHQEYLANSGKAEINRLKATYKDYADWKDEMIALAKELPTLNLQDVYLLARSRNPTKAAERDRHYNPPAPRTQYRTPFSLGPGEGGKAPSNPTTPLSPADAAKAAYEEVAARHPGILAALDNV